MQTFQVNQIFWLTICFQILFSLIGPCLAVLQSIKYHYVAQNQLLKKTKLRVGAAPCTFYWNQIEAFQRMSTKRNEVPSTKTGWDIEFWSYRNFMSLHVFYPRYYGISNYCISQGMVWEAKKLDPRLKIPDPRDANVQMPCQSKTKPLA